MNVQHILDSIEQTGLSHWVMGHYWVWPTMETMHFVGLSALFGGLRLPTSPRSKLPPPSEKPGCPVRVSALFGGLALADLRLIGYMKNIPYKALSKIIPLAVVGFIINTITGVLFFIGNPHRYYPNVAFRFKMLCILLAGLNLLLYQFVVKPKADTWGAGDKTTWIAKCVGVASILLWIGVITGGRLIPFLE